MDIQQNTLYLLTPGSYVSRDHLTLLVEVPVYPPDLPPENRSRDTATEVRKQLIERGSYTDEQLPSVQTIASKLNVLGFRLRTVVKSRPQKK